MVNLEVVQVTKLVTNVLDSLAIRYVVGGSIASIIHGMSRSTLDVDIVADIRPQHIATFVAGLRDAFYLDEQVVTRAVENRGSFNLIHLATMFKVDIFVAKERPFDQQQLDRRILEKITDNSDETIWVLSPEDIVLAKLEWFRLGREVSERQWRDVLGVMKTQQGMLDVGYLREWAGELGVVALLEQVLVEMGIEG